MIDWLHQRLALLWIFWLLWRQPAHLFDRLYRLPWYRQVLQQWVGDLDLPVGCHVLETGCASGELSLHLAARGFRCSAIDFSADMIALARQKPGVQAVEIAQADVMALPFAERYFDAVISASLVNIVSDAQQSVVEMARVCRPGGVVSLLVPAQNFSTRDFARLLVSLKLKGFSATAMKSWRRMAPPMSSQGLESLLQNAGLVKVTSHTALQGMLLIAQGQMRCT